MATKLPFHEAMGQCAAAGGSHLAEFDSQAQYDALTLMAGIN